MAESSNDIGTTSRTGNLIFGGFTMLQFALLTDSDLNQPLGEFADKMSELIDSFWWLFLTLAAVLIVAWGAYVGIKYVVAQRNEQKVEAHDLIKQLLIGILIIVAITVGGPLIVKGLSAWMGTPIEKDDTHENDDTARIECQVESLSFDGSFDTTNDCGIVFTVVEPDF